MYVYQLNTSPKNGSNVACAHEDDRAYSLQIQFSPQIVSLTVFQPSAHTYMHRPSLTDTHTHMFHIYTCVPRLMHIVWRLLVTLACEHDEWVICNQYKKKRAAQSGVRARALLGCCAPHGRARALAQIVPIAESEFSAVGWRDRLNHLYSNCFRERTHRLDYFTHSGSGDRENSCGSIVARSHRRG